MPNIFFDYIKNNDFINDSLGLTENDALKLSSDLERILEKFILDKIKQAKSPETKDMLIEILLFIKKIN